MSLTTSPCTATIQLGGHTFACVLPDCNGIHHYFVQALDG